MRKFYSRILAVCMAGTMVFTPFTPVGTLIGNNITIEAKAADAVDTSWYDNRTEGQTEFTITTAAQLRGLAELVNKNEDIFSECKIKLGKDIDLNNEQWTPIGNGYEFNGEFDGQGYTIYNLKESEIEDANYIKENFTCADIHMARPSESIVIKDINGDDRKISEYEATNVAISRLKELAGLIKKQINLLTKKEISYIIITGGVTNLPYFEHFIQDNFKDLANYEVVKELGVRDNRYSNVVGAIKYYNSRLKLRNVEISIFDLEQQEELGGTSKKVNISENSLLGKIYGYFFDN